MIETANTVDHRVARLEAENKRLRDALEKISKAWDTDLYTWDLYLIAKEALKEGDDIMAITRRNRIE